MFEASQPHIFSLIREALIDCATHIPVQLRHYIDDFFAYLQAISALKTSSAAIDWIEDLGKGLACHSNQPRQYAPLCTEF